MDPFWIRRARGELQNKAINEAFLPHPQTGSPQTIFNGRHQMHGDPERETMVYPTIRFRGPDEQFGPGLQRMRDIQAIAEAFRKQDYATFPNMEEANDFARRLSGSIVRN